MRIKLYRPNFVTGFDDVYYEVKSKEDLFESELCKVWTKDGYDIAFDFKPLQSAIIAINKDRKSWWVIALIHNKPDMELLKDWLPDFDKMRMTMASYDEVKGCITMGPKDNHLYRIPITYIPTEEQIRNLREFFGWDFIKEGEDEL